MKSKGIYSMHGHSYTPEYRAWQAMKKRCFNKTDPRYKDYGGRGITVEPSWLEYKNFIKDIGPRPSNKYSLERIDNEKNYSSDNCRWATHKEQSRNTRRNVYFEFRGHKKSISEWAEITGLSKGIISYRIKTAWEHEKVLTKPSERASPEEVVALLKLWDGPIFKQDG